MEIASFIFIKPQQVAEKHGYVWTFLYVNIIISKMAVVWNLEVDITENYAPKWMTVVLVLLHHTDSSFGRKWVS